MPESGWCLHRGHPAPPPPLPPSQWVGALPLALLCGEWAQHLGYKVQLVQVALPGEEGQRGGQLCQQAAWWQKEGQVGRRVSG